MSGIFRPAQGVVQNVTANAGNRAFIKGGMVAPLLPLAQGMAVMPTLFAPMGVEFWYAFGEHFSGAGSYSIAGNLAPWMQFDENTGILSGEPDALGTWPNLHVSLNYAGHQADTDTFTVQVVA